MPGKRATKTNNLLKKDTFNDIQQRLEKLEAMIANAYKRDHQSQVLVRNNESFDWDQFTLVILNSPIPTTGPHFNESKLITASRTPDLHVYDPDLTYAVVQFKTSQVVNSVPGIGPGVVLGLTNALFVSGADDSKPFAIPTTEAGKFDTTDSATPFKLHGIDSATNIGKIIMLGNSGTGAGGREICFATADAAFTTSSLTVSVTIVESLQGSASGTVTAYNPTAISGATGNAWAGNAGNGLWIIKSQETDDWHIFNVVPTICDCDTSGTGGGPEPGTP